ncbi:MAG: DUF4199 domain-containing protein [Bacteroidales bacterium]|nr:DUF4199 domain-containing protein [Candidatus Cacconaster equifaecalis]
MMTNKKTIWTEAGMPGLVLGLIPVVCVALNAITGSSVVAVVLWLAKLVGCAWLMYAFMKKFVSLHSDAGNSDAFLFGVIVALLSAFVYSAFNYLYSTLLKPDMYSEAFETMMQNYNSMLDANTKEQLENLIPKLPVIGLFANLVYCFVYGTVLSAIFSRTIVPQNPFESDHIDEQ